MRTLQSVFLHYSIGAFPKKKTYSAYKFNMHVFPWNKLKILALQCCKFADICSSIYNVHTAHDIRERLHIIPWQVHPMWHWLLCDYDVRPVVKRLETLKEWYINLLFLYYIFFGQTSQGLGYRESVTQRFPFIKRQGYCGCLSLGAVF